MTVPGLIIGLLLGAVVLAPLAAFALKRRDSGLEIVVFFVQVIAYVAYEILLPPADNRADLVVFVFPAIGLNAWIVFGGLGSVKGGAARGDALPGVSTPLGRVTCSLCGVACEPREPAVGSAPAPPPLCGACMSSSGLTRGDRT